MRKTLSVVLAGVLVTMFCSLALAEEKKESMMGKGKMMGMGDMCGMMMNSMMMGKSLVATSDGGVIVLIGNKLQKYDKDLVLKKEVEIKLDMEAMQKIMMQMMEKYPMHEKMMGGAKDEPKEKEASSDMSGHEAHH